MRKTVYLLLFFVALILCIGLVTVGTTTIGNPKLGSLAVRQMIWVGIAIVAGFVTASFHFRLWGSFAYLILGLSALMLALVLAPGIGKEIAGSRRWLDLGFMNYQPSEFAKLAVVVFVSFWMSTVHRRSETLWKGFLVPVAAVIVLALLIVVEPDYGTTALIVGITGLLLFLSGSRLAFLSAAGMLAVAALVALVLIRPNSMARVEAWFNQGNDQLDNPAAFQLEQSLIAIEMGGVRGVGLGESQQKELYLPEAHTDFIMAIWSEEQGLVGSLILLALFFGIFVCGLVISQSCKDRFGRLLGLGITLMITAQALINMMVVTGLLPTKGIALPLMSYGGSHLLTTCVMLGILISIARHNEKVAEGIPFAGSEIWS